MATTKTKVYDPLVDELPPSEEPRPKSADDVKFAIEIEPYVAGGRTWFRWKIIDHPYKGYVGDYSNHSSQPNRPFESAEEAEENVREYVTRVRHAVQLKLDAPDIVRLTI